MKFCPNCGFPLEGKEKCECGYDVKTGEVDVEVSQQYNETIKGNYDRQCDNLFVGSMGGFFNPNEQPVIFNKEPDIIMGADYIEQMKQFHKDLEEIKKNMEN